jgi:hypothetical protein
MGRFEELAGLAAERRIVAPCDDHCAAEYPVLWSFITADLAGEGQTRTLPTITIQVESGGYVITYQDHDLHKQCKATFLELEVAFRVLEQAMGDPRTLWVEYKSRRNPKGIAGAVDKASAGGRRKKKR